MQATPPGPLCCILWAFSGVALLWADGKFTINKTAGGGRQQFSGHFRAHGALH